MKTFSNPSKTRFIIAGIVLASIAWFNINATPPIDTNQFKTAIMKLLSMSATPEMSALINAEALKKNEWKAAKMPEDTTIHYKIIKTGFEFPNSLQSAVGEVKGKRAYFTILEEFTDLSAAKNRTDEYRLAVIDTRKLTLTGSNDKGKPDYMEYAFAPVKDAAAGINQNKLVLSMFKNQYNEHYYIKLAVYPEE